MSGRAALTTYCLVLTLYCALLYWGMTVAVRGSHFILAGIGALLISIVPMALVGMLLEQRPLKQMFGLDGSWAFILGDSFALPLSLAAAAYAWRFLDRSDAWYASNWWVFVSLAVGVAFGIGFRLMDAANYPREALVSPSKILHDPFVYAVFAASVVYAGIPVVIVAIQRLVAQARFEPKFMVAASLALFGVLLWGAFAVRDIKVGLNHADLHPIYHWNIRTAYWVPNYS